MYMKMSVELLTELCVFVCSAVGFFYGTAVFLAKRSPLYAKMITGAVGCMMFGSMLAVVRRLTGLEARTFQLDHLAYIGVFLFLLTANAGLMDGLADDRSKSFVKYRLLAFAAPLVCALIYVPLFLSELPTAAKVIYGVVALFACSCAYYNFKHAIFPDVDFGVIRCVRGYNLLALAYAVLYMGMVTARVLELRTVSLIVSGLICVDTVLILPLLKRGIEKWRT